MTPFGDWLARHRVTEIAAGAALGIGRAHVSKIARGLTLPSLLVAARIEAYTDGEVPMQSWTPWLRG